MHSCLKKRILLFCCLAYGCLPALPDETGPVVDVAQMDEEEIDNLDAHPWEASSFYAVAGPDNPDKGSLFFMKVLRSPKDHLYMMNGRKMFELNPPELPEQSFRHLNPVALPPEVRKGRCGFSKEQSAQYRFSFMEKVSMRENFFLFNDGGDVFVPDGSRIKEMKRIAVRQNDDSLRMVKCALEARNGKLPVLYRRGTQEKRESLYLGIVSLSDGSLEELAPYDNAMSTIASVRWLADRKILVVTNRPLTLVSKCWCIYDTGRKKMVCRDATDPQDWTTWVRCLLGRSGMLYGLSCTGAWKRVILRLIERP
ncbi:hypothetical protein [Akkermansia sp.]|uniref:hypothetical protein n=1 Tax=Akkermansia sp. TaxID=1872421 RepID=UPI0025C51EE5|nr:hypothetical protein [Akkermansia sp.]MCC8148740.1 hypothetical protein [Akkermansia sp.]